MSLHLTPVNDEKNPYYSNPLTEIKLVNSIIVESHNGDSQNDSSFPKSLNENSSRHINVSPLTQTFDDEFTDRGESQFFNLGVRNQNKEDTGNNLSLSGVLLPNPYPRRKKKSNFMENFRSQGSNKNIGLQQSEENDKRKFENSEKITLDENFKDYNRKIKGKSLHDRMEMLEGALEDNIKSNLEENLMKIKDTLMEFRQPRQRIFEIYGNHGYYPNKNEDQYRSNASQSENTGNQYENTGNQSENKGNNNISYNQPKESINYISQARSNTTDQNNIEIDKSRSMTMGDRYFQNSLSQEKYASHDFYKSLSFFEKSQKDDIDDPLIYTESKVSEEMLNKESFNSKIDDDSYHNKHLRDQDYSKNFFSSNFDSIERNKIKSPLIQNVKNYFEQHNSNSDSIKIPQSHFNQSLSKSTTEPSTTNSRTLKHNEFESTESKPQSYLQSYNHTPQIVKDFSYNGSSIKKPLAIPNNKCHQKVEKCCSAINSSHNNSFFMKQNIIESNQAFNDNNNKIIQNDEKSKSNSNIKSRIKDCDDNDNQANNQNVMNISKYRCANAQEPKFISISKKVYSPKGQKINKSSPIKSSEKKDKKSLSKDYNSKIEVNNIFSTKFHATNDDELYECETKSFENIKNQDFSDTLNEDLSGNALDHHDYQFYQYGAPNNITLNTSIINRSQQEKPAIKDNTHKAVILIL